MTAPLHPALIAQEPLGAPLLALAKPVPLAAPQPLAQVLLDRGAVTPADLLQAMAIAARSQARLPDILCAHGMIDPADLLAARAAQWRVAIADFDTLPADPRLADALGLESCLDWAVLPWRRCGGVVTVATARPETFAGLRPELEARLGPVAMALTDEAALQEALQRIRGSRLRERAEQRTAEQDSCRASLLPRLRLAVLGGLGLLAAGLALAPRLTVALLALWAVLVLVAGTALKLAAVWAARRARAEARAEAFGAPPPVIARMPVVSIIVPLHGERDIAPRLVRRLDRLAYPRELLDVLIVVEADDRATRTALAEAGLPPWMRVLAVPPGQLRTKPRAMNYALDFCRGAIVGIYDAEDAPDPDQIHRVVRRFQTRGAEVACLQGVLDYYNARQNWLSRCFAIEYAVWFRLLLPGLARLGLVVPLGGTTVFFRRAALEAVGAWDAHNVTEDADLGVRLARAGYRTELIDTVTAEEATCRTLPWIRQRSRWTKGYAITYASHMRAPRRLWRDLGAWRFAGFQVLFLSTLTHALLAPVLWSFWLIPLGIGHPLQGLLPGWLMLGLVGLFIAAEAVTLGVNLAAVSERRRHRWLRPWVPTLHLYHPLACLAGLKAVWELIVRPVYWDKTAHGRFDAGAPAPIRRAGGRAAARRPALSA